MAAQALGHMQEVAACHPGVLPALLAALSDRHALAYPPLSTPLCVIAAEALGEIGDVAARHSGVLPAVVALVREHVSGWNLALTALGQMGREAARNSAAVEVVGNLILDHEDGLHLMLMELGRREAMPLIREALVHHPKTRAVLVASVRKCGSKQHGLATALLGEMGEAAADYPDVLAALFSAKDDSHHLVRPFQALNSIMDSGVRIFVRGQKVSGKTVVRLAQYP
jgi:hypothetical protein